MMKSLLKRVHAKGNLRNLPGNGNSNKNKEA